jgi:hypothetical protein
MKLRISAGFLGAVLLLPTLLVARPAQRQAPPIQKGHTTFDYTYQDGLLIEKNGTRFDADGLVKGYSQSIFEYERRRSHVAMRTEFDADMNIRSTHRRTHLYDGKRKLGYDLLHLDADGRQVQRMEARNHVMVDRLGLVHELRIYNKVDVLVQIHYVATDQDERGRLVAKDVSIYDEEGVQRSRRLYTWTHSDDGLVIEKGLEVFDRDDQRSRLEEAVVVRPERGLERSEWTHFDRVNEITGYREVEIRRDAKKRMRTRDTLHFDAEGYATRSHLETFVYDGEGHLIAVRSRREHY